MSKVIELKTVDADKYCSVEEAEKFLGVKASAIRNYLYLNKLTTYKFKGLTLISKRELENWK